MEMHQVRYFLAVCEALNFTRAAEACHVAQPSLTTAIKKLEAELGGELFRRERSRTHLTDLGKLMRPHLETIYAASEAAKADDPTAGSDQDIVEGEAMGWFRPVRWLSLVIGPHVRSLITTTGTERWLFLEARVHTEVSLFGPIKGYADGWRVLAADVNVAEPFDNGYGIDGGLTLSLDALPLAFAIRYRNESATLAGGARLETIEQLAIVVGFGRF